MYIYYSVPLVPLCKYLLNLVTVTILSFILVKVKWSRYRPGVAQKVGRDIALLFHDHDTRMGWERSAACLGPTLPPGKTRYPFYRRPGGPQGRCRRAENHVPTGIRYRTVQSAVSRYTDWATGPTIYPCSHYIYSLWNTSLSKIQWNRATQCLPVVAYNTVYTSVWYLQCVLIAHTSPTSTAGSCSVYQYHKYSMRQNLPLSKVSFNEHFLHLNLLRTR